MHLSGQLSDWSINDLLQIMQVTKKTGSLDIEGDRRGRIHFRNGAVTGAELSGSRGSIAGTDRASIADILYVLSTLTKGSFSVGAADGPDVSGWVVEDILGDVDALRSLEGEVIDAGLFEAAGVRLTADVGQGISIDPEDWAVLVMLVQPFTFNLLEAKLGRGGAVRVFHTLHRLGVAEAVMNEDDESDWLDRLAGDIAPQSGEPTWSEQTAPEAAAPEPEPAPRPVEPAPAPASSVPQHQEDGKVRGVSAPASTTLTDGVYDEIRRLRSKVAER